MHYLDTSFVVSAFTPEARTDDAQVWLEGHPDHAICISNWVATEIASALSMKVRMGRLSIEDREKVLHEWNGFRAANVLVFDVIQEDFLAASDYASRHELNLRAADALHLAIARRNACALVTLDRRMAEAAQAVGVMVVTI